MTELTNEILARYQIRKTKRQKTEFIELMRAHYPELHVETGGLMKSRNIVVGDPESADVVFGAHYDTCAVLPVPNLCCPKNLPLYLLYSILLAVLIFGFCALVAAAVYWVSKSPWIAYWSFLAALVLCLWQMMAGKANRHTVNDNTSGVITLCELMDELSEEERRRAAFVFFDYEELGLIGSMRFYSMHKSAMKGKLLVNLDCVSDGDYLMVIRNRRARVAYDEAVRGAFAPEEGKTVLFEKASRTFYPSDQMNFPCYVAIAAFRRLPVLGYYLSRIHTPRDTVLDERNIAFLRGSLAALLRAVPEGARSNGN